MNSNQRPRKKKFAKSTNEMSKEMLIETLRKKKECNAKALAVVERLIDTSSFNEEWLLSNLKFINQCHFDDVIVERAILKQCGYPLCNGKLENVPSKTYHISTKLNKVYDITERKNFCSEICYKAGMYLKSQLLTSPLWVREQEIIPNFVLLSCNSTASMGEEVVFMEEKEKIKQEVLSEKKDIDSSSVENVCHELQKLELHNENYDVGEIKETVKTDVKQEENCDIEKNENPVQSDVKLEEKSIDNVKETVKVKSLVKEMTFDCDTKSKEIKDEPTRNNIAMDPVKKVEKCIYEWFSFDTLLYLYGEEKVKTLLKNRKDQIKDILGKKPLVPGYNERIDRMVQFYSMLEQEIFDPESANKSLKPLPDYSAIKEDGRKLEVKVQAFYSGQLEIKGLDVIEKKKDGENDEEGEIYLPTVDAHAQNTLRIKILLDRFNKIVPKVMQTVTSENCIETSELRNLVNHFTLSAHNITFNPGESFLMAFILIKLLSVKNKQLERELNNETGRKNMAAFLSNYNLPEDYLDKILEWLVKEENLIKKLEKD